LRISIVMARLYRATGLRRGRIGAGILGCVERTAGQRVTHTDAEGDAPVLPTGTRLVHIGPSKTGTTSLQGALWAARDALIAQGVRYAGHSRHSGAAARAVVGRRSAYSEDGSPPPIRLWEAIVEEIRAAPEQRAMFSSEFLAGARPPAIRRIVEDLDPERIHVVMTLRPLARMLASRWQQNVQTGETIAYDAWLEELFNRPDDAPDMPMWLRHRHDRVLTRWAEIVGLERMTVVVVNDQDHAQVLRAFEGLLGLTPGTLALQDDLANRSLTLAEVEALRAFNVAFKSHQLGRGLQTRVLRLGLAGPMKVRRPAPDEPRIETPQWALDRAGELSREMVANIEASGVRVVGDLSRLVEVPVSGLAGDRLPDPAIPPAIAGSMAMGILLARSDEDEPIELARVPTRRLAIILYRRLRGAVLARYRTARRRLRPTARRA
jgi:hypothetical protein